MIMAKKNAAAPVVENNAAHVENTTTTNTNNTNANAAANVEQDNAAAKENTNANANANNAPRKLDAVEIMETAAAWLRKYGTISAIRDVYATLTNEYGKDNFAAVLKQCKTTRGAMIEDAAAALSANVFTFSGISAAVFAAVAKDNGYTALCQYARREYAGTDAERAAAVIRDYYTAVDANGAPLCKVQHVNAAGTEIYTTFERRALSHTNAVSILKSALDGMKRAAMNAAARATDSTTATRNNVKHVGRVVAVYAAAVDENGRATLGERRDTSADARTKQDAAKMLSGALPVGCVALSVWNAAARGNEDAAAAAGHAANVRK